MSESKLLPCPFCGPRTEEGESVVLLECRDGNFVRGYTVRCDACGIETHGEYESEAAAQWNKRTPMAPASTEAISAGAAAYELLIGAEDGEHDPEDVARTVIGAWVAASALPVPTIGDLNGTSPLPPAPKAASTDSLIATAKRIAWAHWTYWNRVPAGITDVDDLWRALGRYEPEGYLAAARAVAGSPAADPYAGVLERGLLELTKAIFDAPTMDAGYAILADWTQQCGHGVPVALREPQPQADAALVEAPILWCVHHRGPDDLHPVESYEAAVKMADAMNESAERFNFGHKPDSIDYVWSVSYPAVWTGTAESHAEWMEKERANAVRFNGTREQAKLRAEFDALMEEADHA